MPLTKNTPKPLIKVRGIALIEHSIRALKHANISQIVINISYLGAQIKAHLGDGSAFGVSLIYSEETTALETAGGIINALPLLGDAPFLVINSDILCDYDLSQLSLPAGFLANLVLIDNPDHHPNGDFALDGQRIILGAKSPYTFSGIGIYQPDFFTAFGQKKGALALYPVLKKAIESQQLSGEYYPGFWQDVGTPARLKLANNA